MLLEPSDINYILSKSSEDISKKGKKYFESRRVAITEVQKENDEKYMVTTNVTENQIYNVRVSKENNETKYSCNCSEVIENKKPCRHVVATFFDMYINAEEYETFVNKKQEDSFYTNYTENKMKVSAEKVLEVENIKKEESLLSYYESLMLSEINNLNEDNKVKICPILRLQGLGKELTVSFRIGTDKMYVIKEIYKFGSCIRNKEIFKYGKGLEFRHTIESFDNNSRELVSYIDKRMADYNEFADCGNYKFSMKRDYRDVMILKYGALDEFFDIMKNKDIYIDGYNTDEEQKILLVEEDPKLEFNIEEKSDGGLTLFHYNDDYYIFNGQEYAYVLYKNKLHRCSGEFKKNIFPTVVMFKNSNSDIINIKKEDVASFCGYVLPRLKLNADVVYDKELIEKNMPDKLVVKVYLDIDNKNNVLADVKFCYSNIEFNPFDKNNVTSFNRSIIDEITAQALFKQYNFITDEEKQLLYLTDDDDIYRFLKDGINMFMQNFEVLVTDKFKNRQIIAPKVMLMGIRVQNDLLKIDVDDINLNKDELVEVLKSYRLKKKYFKLKNGDYINIEESGFDTLANFVDNLGISEKDILSGEITVPKYRAIYLENISKNSKNIKLNKDDKFNDIVNNINRIEDINFKEPEMLKDILRGYQKIGYSWLKTLSKYNFGGILADDMGLGKTIQVISLLIDEKDNNRATSIVVCPSSLYINWEKEIKKFAPDIKILVIYGGAEERKKLIKKASRYDVIITSYDLLKRDVEEYKDMKFKYIIADEAQYIKNNNTQNAKALKKLKSEVRFALTGTPIENSLAELWSIFDFIMPGYLFSYKRFKENYESTIIKDDNKEAIEKLKKLVSPFILRRLKKEVLKELPDKTDTIMYNDMDEEQRKIYKAFLSSAKVSVQSEIKQNGFEKSKMKILALITRLRQICCHPSLFLDDYNGESSKLNQCLELLEEASSAGHKILLFSQFTSMFEIITKELEKRKIKYSMLTGQTKADTRMGLVDEFNRDKSISVFLISLKAGGTGLNLTGADMVIHYDPWWNLSSQNQATDRAHRIGQKNNVQVFKLITENSIEEKILKLQEKKMNLTNSIIKEGETFISKMEKDDIMELFEG